MISERDLSTLASYIRLKEENSGELLRLFRLAFIHNPEKAYNSLAKMGLVRLASSLQTEHSIGRLEV